MANTKESQSLLFSTTEDQQSGLLSKMFSKLSLPGSSSEEQAEETDGLLSKYASKLKNSATSSLKNFSNKTEEIQTAVSNLKYFAICFIFGCLLLFLSFCYLPFLILMPAKFAKLFTLGCISILISLGLLKGFNSLLTTLLEKERILFSIFYVLSVFCTLYSAYFMHSYLIVLITSFLQIFSLLWLLSSAFPGGTKGMKFISQQILSFFQTLCSWCIRSKENKNFLPI